MKICTHEELATVIILWATLTHENLTPRKFYQQNIVTTKICTLILRYVTSRWKKINRKVTSTVALLSLSAMTACLARRMTAPFRVVAHRLEQP